MPTRSKTPAREASPVIARPHSIPPILLIGARDVGNCESALSSHQPLRIALNCPACTTRPVKDLGSDRRHPATVGRAAAATVGRSHSGGQASAEDVLGFEIMRAG